MKILPKFFLTQNPQNLLKCFELLKILEEEDEDEDDDELQVIFFLLQTLNPNFVWKMVGIYLFFFFFLSFSFWSKWGENVWCVCVSVWKSWDKMGGF